MKAITVLLIAGLWMSIDARAQTAAAWSFSGESVEPSTAGTGVTASKVTMGSGVTGGGRFSGSDFFGQDGWPTTTTIDPNAYMQFSVGPNSGYYIVLNTVVMNLRHSTLGTSAGSGPTSWILSSSLDGYSSVLATGSLTTSYQTFTVTLPAAFHGMMSPVTFRLYGYNVVMTTGGSNRFVTNSITLKGSATPGTLAAQSVDLSAVAGAQTVDLQWQTQGFADGTSFLLQRSADGMQFTTLKTVTGASAVDDPATPGQWYYRIEAQEAEGSSYFSPIVTVMVNGTTGAAGIIKGVAAIKGVAVGGSSVRTFLHLPDAGSYLLNIRTMDGQRVYHIELNGQGGDIATDIALGSRAHGVYVLTLTGNGANRSREFFY